jgi:hypothetical protein
MSKVRGKLVPLDISTDGGTTWKVLICLLSNDLHVTRAVIEAPPSKCDSDTAATQKAPGVLSWDMPFSALLDDTPLSTQLTASDILTLATNGTIVKARQQYDNTGSELYAVGDVLITDLTITNPAEGYTGFSGTFLGSGPIDITP